MQSFSHSPNLYAAAVLLAASAVCFGQGTPVAAPLQLSPGAAYTDAMHPLEVTRHSISNWSDSEIAALTVTMAKAHDACAARDAKRFNGSELIDLAKLCALGQSFGPVVEATTRYIAAEGPKPLLTQAYAGLVDAHLHNKDEPAALAASVAMLGAVPYDTLTAETVDEALDYMQFVYSDDALKLATAREPLLLARIGGTPQSAVLPEGQAGAVPAEPPQSLHELYADGMALAALQQLLKAAEAAATVTAMDAALPATLTPDDAVPIAAARQRYSLLGRPLPLIAGKTYLSMPNKLPQLPAANAITALLLFPDWCAQCVRLATKLPQTVFTVAGHEAYLYGLLAETVPPRKPDPAVSSAAFNPAYAEAILSETPTEVVPPTILEQFAASDVPFLVLTDAQGIVRVLQPVGDDATTPGGVVDSAIARVGALWGIPVSAQKGAATDQKPATEAPPPPRP